MYACHSSGKAGSSEEASRDDYTTKTPPMGHRPEQAPAPRASQHWTGVRKRQLSRQMRRCCMCLPSPKPDCPVRVRVMGCCTGFIVVMPAPISRGRQMFYGPGIGETSLFPASSNFRFMSHSAVVVPPTSQQRRLADAVPGSRRVYLQAIFAVTSRIFQTAALR